MSSFSKNFFLLLFFGNFYLLCFACLYVCLVLAATRLYGAGVKSIKHSHGLATTLVPASSFFFSNSAYPTREIHFTVVGCLHNLLRASHEVKPSRVSFHDNTADPVLPVSTPALHFRVRGFLET